MKNSIDNFPKLKAMFSWSMYNQEFNKHIGSFLAGCLFADLNQKDERGIIKQQRFLSDIKDRCKYMGMNLAEEKLAIDTLIEKKAIVLSKKNMLDEEKSEYILSV